MAQLTLERPLSALDLAIQSHSELLHNALQLDEVEPLTSLPPPPAPFPMEQLALLLATSGERQSLEDDRVSDVLSDAGTDASDVTVSVQYDYDDMTELNLVGIQRHCANCIEILVPPQRTASVSSADQELAGRLTELLEATYELETFHPSSACCSPATPADDESDQSPFLALVHTLLGAQAVVAQRQPRPAPQSPSSETSEHPVEVVREELAWARVETLARDIVELVRSRDDEAIPCFSSEEEDDVKSIFSLPPVYRRSERDSAGSGSSRVSAGSVSSRVSGPPAYKDYRDDRVVAYRSPHAEPASGKARSPLNLRQPTEARLRELDDLWDKIERAHAPIKDAAVDDRRQSRKSYMFHNASIRSSASIKSSKSSTLKARRKPKDLFQIVADASGSRLPNQDVPPLTPKSKKHFLALTGTSKDVPPRSPLSSTGWLPRVASRELLTPRTPATPLSPWGRAPSIGAKTPTSPAFPPNLFDESARASESRSIRKIMGQLVRRRSTVSLKDGGSANTTPKSRPIPLPLPPPPPPPIDPDAVGYLCETQENLRVVQVMLYGGNTAQASDLELEVTTPGGAVVTSRSDPKVRINIALPTPVPLGQRVPFAPADGHMEAKLAALPMSATTLNSHITHALSAPSLRQLAPRSLCCTQCDHEIAEFPSDVTFKDLPSEHWSEMLEVWMCHADPAFTAHIAKQTKDGFWPTSSTVLQESNEADDWRRVSCPCGEVLGKVRQSGPGAGTVRFSKWAISLMRGRGGGEIEAVRFPVSFSQAHASYRFLIADEINGSPRLALWLFNPSMHVAHRRPAKATFSLTSAPPAPSRPSWERPGLLGMRASGDRARGMRNASASRKTESPARSMRAAKIMFKLLDGADRGTAGLPGFGGSVETMRYPRDVCDSLIAALRASTTVYPVSRRALGAFTSGFLERV
ncbi:hypothetical protein CcaverHIS002_0303430 [Cutaneotrichosporon cavernicola]|nr:hypothetical protein CcaverHIS002_0303430 [Cutaneotrichosporon cavernicola]